MVSAKVDAVLRDRHTRDSVADAQAMETHHDPAAFYVNVHIRGGDVRRRDFREDVVRNRRAAGATLCLETREHVGVDGGQGCEEAATAAPSASCREDARAKDP
jgi:hypothetical protein